MEHLQQEATVCDTEKDGGVVGVPRSTRALTFVGIDPGKSGGIAWFDENGDPCAVAFAQCTLTELWELFRKFEGQKALLEKVGATPQMGRSSAFTFGKAAGTVEALATAAMMSWDYITPRKWQQGFGLVVPNSRAASGDSKRPKKAVSDTEKKRRNKQAAERLFSHGIKVTHAIADALLIAEYCRRRELTRGDIF